MATKRADELRDLFATHVPFDSTEAEYLVRMRALCDAEADAFLRTSFKPGHFTASAFIVSPTADALLLIFHQKLGRWLQPGGHVELTDLNVLAAARREAHEEVGLADLTLVLGGPLDLDIHEIPARSCEPMHEHYDVRFLFRTNTMHFEAGSDASAARWFSLDELRADLTDQSVMRAVRKLASLCL